MNMLSAAKENYIQWLPLFTATLLGMLFASALIAQQPFSVIAEQQADLDNFSIAPPTLPQQDCCYELSPADQFVITKDRCPKRTCVSVSSRDQVWLVSARQAHLCPGDISSVRASRLENGVWLQSQVEELTSQHSSNKNYVTFVYVHGNRTDLSWAISRGLQVYQTVFGGQNNSTNRPPIRFVIFAWKSEQERLRLRPDYDLKSKRSPIVGQTFGTFLRQFSDRNVVLCGFSLGSQVVLAGLSQNELHAQASLASRYKVALLAPALDPGYVCSQLTKLTSNRSVERTEVYYSQSDRAIRAAEKIARKSCRAWIPVFQQLARSCNSINPVRVFDITNQVKKRHATDTYVGCVRVQQSLNRMVLEMASRVQVVPDSFETPFEVMPSIPENSHQILIPALAPTTLELSPLN